MPQWEDLYSGELSRRHEIVVVVARVIQKAFTRRGGMLAVAPHKIPGITDGRCPRVFTRHLDAAHTDVDGAGVLTLTPPEPTGKVVIAIHGGSYVGQATVFHWWTYTDIARRTGATVVIPAYTLAPAGTARTEVPRMTDVIAGEINAVGPDNVSVLGDSAGGGLALLATQELVRRDSPVPRRLVLLAPWLDVSMSDPRSSEVDEPLLDLANSARYGRLWAGGDDPQDRGVSPLFGALRGLPTTYVHSSSRDLLTLDALRLRDRVLADDVPGVTFQLRKGLLHDYPIPGCPGHPRNPVRRSGPVGDVLRWAGEVSIERPGAGYRNRARGAAEDGEIVPGAG